MKFKMKSPLIKKRAVNYEKQVAPIENIIKPEEIIEKQLSESSTEKSLV
jgi:hypothetical protein